MKKILRIPLDFVFRKIFPRILSFYIKHIFYRVRQAYGIAVLETIKNKGKNIKIHGFCTIINPEKLLLEDNIRIGNNCYIYATGGVSIGNNTQISRNVVIYSATHNYNGDAIPYDNSFIFEPVKIADSVWIGMNVQILPGVSIGRGSIVGMGSIVTNDIPPFSIAVGCPAKVIKTRDSIKFMKLDDEKKHFGALHPNS